MSSEMKEICGREGCNNKTDIIQYAFMYDKKRRKYLVEIALCDEHDMELQ